MKQTHLTLTCESICTNRWSAIGFLNGEVRSIAVDGDSILVGGDFTQVEGSEGGRGGDESIIAVNNIARYYSGEWMSVAGGLDGTVYSMQVPHDDTFCFVFVFAQTHLTLFMLQSIGSCVYVGGNFLHWFSVDYKEQFPANYLTRLCADGEVEKFERFESFGDIGPVHAILPYAFSEGLAKLHSVEGESKKRQEITNERIAEADLKATSAGEKWTEAEERRKREAEEIAAAETTAKAEVEAKAAEEKRKEEERKKEVEKVAADETKAKADADAEAAEEKRKKEDL